MGVYCLPNCRVCGQVCVCGAPMPSVGLTIGPRVAAETAPGRN